jgi:hypothetical protein
MFRCPEGHPVLGKMKNVKPTTDNRSMKGSPETLGFSLSLVRFALVDVGCPFCLPF